MLSSGQIEHFHTFGFLVIRQCVFQGRSRSADPGGCRGVRAEARTRHRRRGMAVGRGVRGVAPRAHAAGGRRPDLPARGGTAGRRPHLDRFGRDVGDRSETGRSHLAFRRFQDLAVYSTIPRTKVMLYLDPQTKDTGALRVIPGSHRDPNSPGAHAPARRSLGRRPQPVRHRRLPGSQAAPSRPSPAISFCSTNGSTTRFTERRGNGGSSSSSSAPVRAPTPTGTCCFKARRRGSGPTRRSWRASVPGYAVWPKACTLSAGSPDRRTERRRQVKRSASVRRRRQVRRPASVRPAA